MTWLLSILIGIINLCLKLTLELSKHSKEENLPIGELFFAWSSLCHIKFGVNRKCHSIIEGKYNQFITIIGLRKSYFIGYKK